MPLLFSYGTLKDSDVQTSLFGRCLVGREDALLGYDRERILVSDPGFAERSGSASHSILRPSAAPESRIHGVALEVTEAELEIADSYEPQEYRRVLGRLASGGEAWVYVDGAAADPLC
jgi:hypothetical protein